MPRLDEFEGTSVYYAATAMEARFCRSQPVVVVGGGNSAGQATVYLARHAARVRLLIRHDDLGRDLSRYLVDQIERDPDIEVLPHTEVSELVGRDGVLEALVVVDNKTGDVRRLEAGLLFVFIGTQPCTGWLGGSLDLDDHGYVRTGGATGSHWKPAEPAYSPPAMSEAGRSNGWRQPSARDRWRSAWSMSTSCGPAISPAGDPEPSTENGSAWPADRPWGTSS